MLENSPELPEILERMIDVYTDLGNQMIANDLITAKLMCEISRNSADPDAYMMRLTSEVSGLADRLASETKGLADRAYDPTQITQYMYRLCDMAEDLKNSPNFSGDRGVEPDHGNIP